MNYSYICGALFLLFFVAPTAWLFFEIKKAEKDPNED